VQGVIPKKLIMFNFTGLFYFIFKQYSSFSKKKKTPIKARNSGIGYSAAHSRLYLALRSISLMQLIFVIFRVQ
jgi:hypothetical protein